MADIIPFPSRPSDEDRHREEKVIGAKAGIVVRILSQLASPHDLVIVLDGTSESCTTVASISAGEMVLAEFIAHLVLTTLEAAEITWSMRSTASG